MKKRYQTPELLIVAVDVRHTILAGSDPEVGVNPGTPAKPEDPVLVKRGRGGDVWDDDWSQ